ncbi:unnamed protein product [Pleuronectes platessa]|uniref:Uncharacterized protein n=1 Tax=Pleuronectes platessa TaxID=8262 RepID=A0A9N7YIU2_PLEPL|nr:unnamed protein product [Pleuronectes platessa]
MNVDGDIVEDVLTGLTVLASPESCGDSPRGSVQLEERSLLIQHQKLKKESAHKSSEIMKAKGFLHPDEMQKSEWKNWYCSILSVFMTFSEDKMAAEFTSRLHLYLHRSSTSLRFFLAAATAEFKEIRSTQQEAGGRRKEAGGRRQEAGQGRRQGQEAGGRRQEAGGRRQEAGGRRQGGRRQGQGAGGQEAGGRRQQEAAT